jgi:IclR family pca regulon transcriptional regulator
MYKDDENKPHKDGDDESKSRRDGEGKPRQADGEKTLPDGEGRSRRDGGEKPQGDGEGKSRQDGEEEPQGDGQGKSRRGDGGKQSAGGGRPGKAGGPRAGRARAVPKPRIRPAAEPRLSRSLEYGVAILESFSGERQALGIADLAEVVGISRSTTHRYAMTLVALGFLEQDAKRKYRLANRAAGPGRAVIGAIRREVAARAVLEELRDDTGHTVSMGVLSGSRVIYVHRLLGHRAGQHEIDRDLGAGASVPAYCSALGKILLASLSEAERRERLAGIKLTRHGPNTILKRAELAAELERISPSGVLLSDEELVAGSRSIAALVPRPHSEHPLAIDVTVPSLAYTVDKLTKSIGPRVKRAARLIAGE